MKKITALLVLFLFLYSSHAQKTILGGYINNLSANSIKCSFIPNHVLEKISAITIPVTGGKFVQELSITQTVFVSFEEGKNYYAGVIEPGDSITITYDAADLNNSLMFSGKGKEKFMLVNAINQIRLLFTAEAAYIKSQPFPVDYLFNRIDSIQNRVLTSLSGYKSSMTAESFALLYAFCKATVLRAKYNGVINAFGDAYDRILMNQQARLTPASKKAMHDLLTFDDNLFHSYFYTTTVNGIFSAYISDNIQPAIGDNLAAKYNYINKQLPEKLKTPVLYLFLDREIRQNKDAIIDSIIEQSFALATDNDYKEALIQKLADARALKNNMPAPDFSLENTGGQTIHLSTFKGKVIYLDFWFGACEPCHKLFKQVNPVKDYFKSNDNVVFLTVSVDNREVWKKSLSKFKIPGYHAFTGDKYRDHNIIRNYHVAEYPTTYLIGKNGTIVSISPSHDPGELKKEIEAALLQE